MTSFDFESLDGHWAIGAIGRENLERANDLVHQQLAKNAVGKQIEFSFHLNREDQALLDRVALAYEVAAIEGLDELSRPAGSNENLRNQAIIASSCAFDIRRLFPAPDDALGSILFVLQLSSLAYCGDRGSDLRRWYAENENTLASPRVSDVSWDRRLLYGLFECWVRIFRKAGWDDLDQIHKIIARLRDEQKTKEERRLQNESKSKDRAMALRLVALYHWAKATEILAVFILQGQPGDPFGQIDKHFESAIQAAEASTDAQHEILLRWLHATARIMISNSLWWTTRTVNSRTTDFVKALVKREHEPMFELLPPQRAALAEYGLLDQAKTAIVVDLPTSGGKTLLAQFRILQALNQFDADNGWVAYATPTRALSAQITRRLRRDFGAIGIVVEQLTGAIDVDAFEEHLLNDQDHPFQILVATPEKLSLVIRNKKVKRPLALIVMDEAHNMENDERGLRIELLLATVKRDCAQANFLLLTPDMENTDVIARWLAQDVNAGQAISIGTSPWKPNERIIGLYRATQDSSQTAGWRMEYEALSTTPKTMPLRGTHRVGETKPIDIPKSKVIKSNREQTGMGLQTAAMGVTMSSRGTSIVVANRIKTVWSMAEMSARKLGKLDSMDADIKLVQDFLHTEISPDFELIKILSCGVGVHHAGLSDEVRALMEWLAERGRLRVLCATSTIAQGINFPVSSVFLQSRFVSNKGGSVEISPRDFWNLAGRAGRIKHDSVGVIGLAEGNDREDVIKFIGKNTGSLVSRLVTLLDKIEKKGSLDYLSAVISQNQWDDFRSYVAHIWAEKNDLNAVLADSELLLRQTYGYTTLRNNPEKQAQAEALLTATKEYVQQLDQMPAYTAKLADATGFSPEGVTTALNELKNLKQKMITSDWMPSSIFGESNNMATLFGVMLKVPQLKKQLSEIGGKSLDHTEISNITQDWVNGISMDQIASKYFAQDDNTKALTDACLAIYRTIINNGTWGISALSKVSGIDFEALSETERRHINVLPAMIYHGVRSEDAVLMRMNFAPRSAAEALGTLYRKTTSNDKNRYSVERARKFLRGLASDEWEDVRPADAALSGRDYKQVWEILSGEGEHI